MAAEGATLAPARPAIAIAGNDEPLLAAGLVELRVHENVEGLASCEATFGNWGARDGGVGYLYFDRELLDFGRELTVTASGERIFDGRITGIDGHFPEGSPPTVTLLAEDRFQDLRMTRRTRTFHDVTDQAVMTQVASDHGLGADVSVSGPSHRVIAQVNQSDLAFLRERARAIDAELWLDRGALRARRHTDRDGATVQLGYGNELRRVSVLADLAGQRTSVSVTGWDVQGKAALGETATDSVVQPELGSGESGASVLRGVLGERKETVAQSVPLTGAEARARVESSFRQRARRFLTGHGVAETLPGLRVGAFATFEGLGALFSGGFYVTEVTHLFDGDRGLRTHFAVERPALGRAV